MADFLKRVIGLPVPGDDTGRSTKPLPAQPPSPKLETLSPQEIEILNEVFKRQEAFDRTDREELKYMKEMIIHIEEKIAKQQMNKSWLMQPSHSVCRLCCKTKFAEKVGRQCHSCGYRICSRCGLYANDPKATRWRCRLCQLKRDFASKTGQWYHGTRAQPTLDTDEIWLAVQRSRSRSSSVCYGEPAAALLHQQEPRKRQQSLHDISINRNIRNARKDINYFGQPSNAQQWTTPPPSPSQETRGCPSDIHSAGEDSDDEASHDINMLSRRHEPSQSPIRILRHSNSSAPIIGTSSSLDSGSDITESRSESLDYNQTTESSSERNRGYYGERRRSLSEDNIHSVREIRQRTIDLTDGLGGSIDDIAKARRISCDPKIQINGTPLTDTPSHRRRRTGQQAVRAGPPRTLRRHLAPTTTDEGSSINDTPTASPSERPRMYQSIVPPMSHLGGGRGSLSSRGRARPMKVTGKVMPIVGDSPGFHHRAFCKSPGAPVHDVDLRSRTDSESTTEEWNPQPRVRPRSATIGSVSSINRPVRQNGEKPKVSCPTMRRMGSQEDFKKPIMNAWEKKSEKSDDRGSATFDLSHQGSKSASPVRRNPHSRRNMVSSRRDGSRYLTVGVDKDCMKEVMSVDRFPTEVDHNVVIHKDKSGSSHRMNGLGMRVVGGKPTGHRKLGAIVTDVLKNGPAKLQGNMQIGDEIISWNGKSLVNATYEEALDIIDQPGDFVQLVVRHACHENPPSDDISTDDIESLNSAATPSQRGATSADESSSVSSASLHLAPAPVPRPRLMRQKRSGSRKLPDIPVDVRVAKSCWNSGRILMKLHLDDDKSLVVMLVRSEGLRFRKEVDKELPNPYAHVSLIPDRTKFESYKTAPFVGVREAHWFVTYTFPGVSESMMRHGTLEVTMWDAVSKDNSEFLGEVLLDLCELESRDREIWYDLQEHDENSGSLPKPGPVDLKPSVCSTRRAISLEDAEQRSPSESEHVLKRKKKRPPRLPHANSDGEDEEQLIDTEDVVKPSPDTLSPDYKGSDIKEGEKSFRSRVKRKVSHAIEKLSGASNQNDNKRTSTSDSNDKQLGFDPDSVSGNSKSLQSASSLDSTPPLASPGPKKKSGSFNIDLMAPPTALSQANSVEALDEIGSDSEDASYPDNERPAPEGDDIPTLLGPGQVASRNSTEQLTLGDIKLGFIMTKGNLEVHVLSAKGLSPGTNGQAPDTYVKTYLTDGHKKTQKKKTSIVKCNCNPLYRQKIKYSACNIYRRQIQASVWEKSSAFEKNQCIGEVVVSMDELDLTILTTSWYTLFKQSAADQGSSDSLYY